MTAVHNLGDEDTPSLVTHNLLPAHVGGSAAMVIDGKDAVVPDIESRILTVAKAIWDSRNDSDPKGRTWAALCASVSWNKYFANDYERVIRQARAVVALDVPRDAVIQAARFACVESYPAENARRRRMLRDTIDALDAVEKRG